MDAKEPSAPEGASHPNPEPVGEQHEHFSHKFDRNPSRLGLIQGANFPMDAEGRVYHLGVKRGEVANRILSVGDAGRAQLLASLLDERDAQKAKVVSNRGFTVYSGKFNSVPITVVATGMGLPMMDFVVRECRAVVTGPMAIVRFGTCGTPQARVAVGSLVVADSSVLIRRNPDYFLAPKAARSRLHDEAGQSPQPYDFSKPVPSDPLLSNLLHNKLEAVALPGKGQLVRGSNASADSFYSSQGRLDMHFDDANEHVIDDLLNQYPDVQALEMETFQLYHLAACSHGVVHGAACTIVLAQRKSNEFLTHEEKVFLEESGGRACLQALADLPLERTMNYPECYWNLPEEQRVHL